MNDNTDSHAPAGQENTLFPQEPSSSLPDDMDMGATIAGMPAPDELEDTMAAAPTAGGSTGGGHPQTTAPTILAGGQVSGSREKEPQPGEIWGDYRFEKKIGQGGMGAVFLCTQTSLDRQVAIKVLPAHLSSDPDFKERFSLEAKTVARLSSPHIVQVIHYGEAHGSTYFAMEFVKGKDLSERLKEGMNPTYSDSLNLILQAAKGLADAGEHDLVHRDIKPGNMMVTDKGHLKLMDFGLVRVASQDQGMTMAGTVMGTVTYFSPEQGRGEVCDQRTDIYALGVVFYELLTGQVPFSGSDATSIIYQHIHTEPVLPTEVNGEIPEHMQAIVMKCMQKDKENRYKNALELINDLEQVQRGLEPGNAFSNMELLRTGASIVKSSQFKKEKKGKGLLLSAVLLAAVGGGGFVWYSQFGGKAIIDEHVLGKTPKKPWEKPIITDNEQDGLTDTPVISEQPVAVEDAEAQQAYDMITGKRFADAQEMITKHLTQDVTSKDWNTLQKRLYGAQVSDALERARSALADNNTAVAREQADIIDRIQPGSAELPRLRAQIEALQKLSEQVKAAREALTLGDGTAAQAALDVLIKDGSVDIAENPVLIELQDTARQLFEMNSAADEALVRRDYTQASSLYTESLRVYPNEHARHGLEAVTDAKAFTEALAEAIDKTVEDVSLATPFIEEAQAALDHMTTLMPDSQPVKENEKSLRIHKLFFKGRAACQSNALDEARLVLADLVRLDSEHAVTQTLDHACKEIEAIQLLRTYLAQKNLDAATAQVEEIAKLSPNSLVLETAQQALKESCLAEELAAKAAQELEKSIATGFAELRTVIESDGLSPLAGAEQLALLAKEYGEDRPEIAVITELLAQKEAYQGVKSSLRLIDELVLSGKTDTEKDGKNINMLIADSAYLGRLEQLQSLKNLVFTHTLTSCERINDKAQVETVLRNGFDTYPAEDLPMTYRFVLKKIAGEDIWVLTEIIPTEKK